MSSLTQNPDSYIKSYLSSNGISYDIYKYNGVCRFRLTDKSKGGAFVSVPDDVRAQCISDIKNKTLVSDNFIGIFNSIDGNDYYVSKSPNGSVRYRIYDIEAGRTGKFVRAPPDA